LFCSVVFCIKALHRAFCETAKLLTICFWGYASFHQSHNLILSNQGLENNIEKSLKKGF